MVFNSKINVMNTVLSLETGGLERIVSESALLIDKNRFGVSICCFDRFGDFANDLIKKWDKCYIATKKPASL